jgi:release factor glutamine methyltransferase
VIPELHPSEYTAALIQVLRDRAHQVKGARAVEIGSGSGVVLAALGALGAKSLCGVDVEEAAVADSQELLRGLGHAASEILHGDLWKPVAGRRFDVIAANLPHFPMERGDVPGRLPTWSAGGADGRRLLNPFLNSLAGHLAPGGRAFITHNGFVGMERSRDILQRNGLRLDIVLSTLVYISQDKLARMTPSILAAEDGRTIHHYGPHTFGEMHIVEIGAAGR